MNDTPQSYYWVISELPTPVSKPQRYISETRMFKTISSANDWRECIESSYRKSGDNRKVLLVKVLSPEEIKKAIGDE